MGAIVTIGPDVDLPENPQVQELVHGGYRQNHHHQYIEDAADPRHMGRELLKRTTPLDMADNDGVAEIMAAASPVGTEKYQTSKWSK